MTSIKFKNNKLFYLDQTKLPFKEIWCECRNLTDGFSAIKRLSVRGAPLIGVFAAYCIVVHLKHLPDEKSGFVGELNKAIKLLKTCRPTAVNLVWALKRLEQVVLNNKSKDSKVIKQALLREAIAIHREDVKFCANMGKFGATLVKKGDRILTHCNAGLLATSGMGTALSVIFQAHLLGRNIFVYADETRPLLQGARLTAWELLKRGVPSKVICDNMAASLMKQGQITKIFLGADRIAANGDTANKIGTYSLAVLAKYHKIPFYVVAPFSTFDLSLSRGELIPIEERDQEEVKVILGKIAIAPKKAKAYNPAFDLTPAKLITAIVTDKGIIRAPYAKNIKKILGK